MSTGGAVAPPRGERGLKSSGTAFAPVTYFVAPPRGERGLKFRYYLQVRPLCESLPLVGSVD